MPMPPRFATLLLLFLPWMAFAQPASNPRVESLRIAFITERLELSPKESEAFWPAIRVHHRELESLRRRIDDLLDEAKAGVTENRAEEIFTALQGLQQAELERRDLLLKDAAGVIGFARALRLPAAEREFRMRMAEEIRDRRSGPPARH
jgi:hypothetical protein